MKRRASAPKPSAMASTGPVARARIVIRGDLRDADGQPRVALDLPGRRVPLAFPNIGAALAALAIMEGRA